MGECVEVISTLFCVARACANALPQDMNSAMIGISSQVRRIRTYSIFIVCVRVQ